MDKMNKRELILAVARDLFTDYKIKIETDSPEEQIKATSKNFALMVEEVTNIVEKTPN